MNTVKQSPLQTETLTKPNSKTDPKIKKRLQTISKMLIEKNKDAYRRLANR